MQHAPDDKVADPKARNRSPGLVLHRAAHYDLLVSLLTRRRERALRERMLDLARLERGARVLDVGCGTGTLAIAAARRIGPSGSAVGMNGLQFGLAGQR